MMIDIELPTVQFSSLGSTVEEGSSLCSSGFLPQVLQQQANIKHLIGFPHLICSRLVQL